MVKPEPVVGPEPVAGRRRGRRPAGEDTRGVIIVAARSEFSSRGYDSTTMRGIARAAGVDARLMHHYFDGKEDVFVEAMGLPVRPHELVAHLLAGPREELGMRVVRAFLRIWDSPDGSDRMRAMLGGALASDAAARMLREFLTSQMLGPIAAGLEVDRGELRAALAATHLVGLAMGRMILRIEPLTQLGSDELAVIVGPVLQHYLTDPNL